MLVRPFLVLCLVLAAAPATAAETSLDFTTAQERAAERDVPIVIDFFTDWCVYCKHFDRDLADASTGVAAALDDAVFLSIDAEKGEGIELAKKYTVTGFPTYVVVDAQGELIDRWAGYGGPEHFLTALDEAMADTRTLAAKRAAFEERPTAALAEKFASIESGTGNYDAAIALYEQAEELDSARDHAAEILQARFMKLRRGVAGYDLDAFVADARSAALTDDADPALVVMTSQMVGTMAQRAGRPELERPFLEAALRALETAGPDEVDPRSRAAIEIAGHLRITGDTQQAVAAKKSTLPEGWRDDADQLNSFAWWCFENDVDLAEAEQLARRGVELAQPGKQKAQVLDTAAEICNARGNCRDAVTLIERAIAEAPDDGYYQQQLERFQKILASTE
ncbi:MAG TPA: thioredoxin family protein [Candidatus Krumholzibacteria bacterium]|nr:thioredoxin family protein [Candidatus Krumholzibacteria bacterium]